MLSRELHRAINQEADVYARQLNKAITRAFWFGRWDKLRQEIITVDNCTTTVHKNPQVKLRLRKLVNRKTGTNWF